jgi:hypothetical protein
MGLGMITGRLLFRLSFDEPSRIQLIGDPEGKLITQTS